MDTEPRRLPSDVSRLRTSAERPRSLNEASVVELLRLQSDATCTSAELPSESSTEPPRRLGPSVDGARAKTDGAQANGNGAQDEADGAQDEADGAADVTRTHGEVDGTSSAPRADADDDADGIANAEGNGAARADGAAEAEADGGQAEGDGARADGINCDGNGNGGNDSINDVGNDDSGGGDGSIVDGSIGEGGRGGDGCVGDNSSLVAVTSGTKCDAECSKSAAEVLRPPSEARAEPPRPLSELPGLLPSDTSVNMPWPPSIDTSVNMPWPPSIEPSAK